MDTKPTGPTTARRRCGTLFAALLLPALLGSCKTLWQPEPSAAATLGELPGRWTAPGSVPRPAATGWLDDFGSPALRELVEEAVGRNYNLASSRTRIAQALERARLARADMLPTLDSSMSTSRSQNLRGAAFLKTRANTYNLGLDFAWEADIWGRLKNLRDAELDRIDAETALYESARLSLAANVVKAALAAIEARGQIAISRRTLSSLQTNLKILDSRLEAGDLAERAALEISLSRADIARAERAILISQRRLDGARRTLETLLGRYPSGEIDTLAQLPRLVREVPAGLPSDLLLRRPDILAAEARVDAATRELLASRKALLPALRLSGSGGTASTRDISDILNIQNLVWNIGQNLTQPLFRGGRLLAQIRLDEAGREELVYFYAETALEAFREVETALAAESFLKAEVAALTTASTESRRAEELGLGEFEQGLVEIITLLESQRRAFEAESVLLDARLELLTNRIDLHLALGGDFDHLPPLAASEPAPVPEASAAPSP